MKKNKEKLKEIRQELDETSKKEVGDVSMDFSKVVREAQDNAQSVLLKDIAEKTFESVKRYYTEKEKTEKETADKRIKDMHDTVNFSIQGVMESIQQVRDDNEATDETITEELDAIYEECERLQLEMHSASDAINARVDLLEKELNGVDGKLSPRFQEIHDLLISHAVSTRKGHEALSKTLERLRTDSDGRYNESKGFTDQVKKLEEDLKKWSSQIYEYGTSLQVLNNGTLVGFTGQMNFKAGTGVSITTVGNGQSIDVTINATGSSGGTVVSEEIPTDSGDHTHFTLAHTPLTGTFKLYRGGARQQASVDFTRTGTALTLPTVLATGEVLICDYTY